MKILTYFIMILFFAIPPFPQEKGIKIYKKRPQTALQNHKVYDVVIYKTTLTLGERTGNFYVVNFYRNENNTLREFQCFYGSDNKFNKAFYKWENDSTVSLRLYNLKNKNQEIFKVYGSKQTTGITKP